jgi:TRAP-type C4-dicarboxylate transport system permease small subunit
MRAHQTHAETNPRDPAIGAIPRVLRLLSLAEDVVLVMLLAAMILVAAAQILLRNFFDTGLAWGDQALRVMVLWLGLVGAVAASRNNKHINIEVLLRFMPQPAKVVSQTVVALFTVLVCAVIAFYAGRFVYLDYRMGTMAFGDIPAWVAEIILPVGFSLIALRYLCLAADQLKNSRSKEGGR